MWNFLFKIIKNYFKYFIKIIIITIFILTITKFNAQVFFKYHDPNYVIRQNHKLIFKEYLLYEFKFKKIYHFLDLLLGLILGST